MPIQILLIVAVAALLVFMLLNARKQKAQRERLASNLKVGAKVMTGFGVFGTIVDVDDDGTKLTIETTPGTQLIVHKQAIGQILPPEEPEAEESPAVIDTDTDKK